MEESLKCVLMALDEVATTTTSTTFDHTTTTTFILTVRGDDAFYGQGQKTGLGSSACLVTSMVGALCHVFQLSSTTTSITLTELLAQMAHALAQKKIGSGFDVSAALHGTHLYTPSVVLQRILQPVLDHHPCPTTLRDCLQQFQTVFASSPNNNNNIHNMVQPFQLPSDWQISMADVAGGSQSPSMARAVLQWKQQHNNNKNNNTLWKDLQDTNRRIVQMFADTSSQLVDNIPTLRREFRLLRKYYKQMGEQANVPIEPDSQTKLADMTMEIPGVIVALVPGAGGHDALCCLHLKSARQQVHDFWNAQPNVSVLPIQALEGNQRGLTITS